jgi:hypothetical protein
VPEQKTKNEEMKMTATNIALSEMNIGDRAYYMGDLVELRDGGKSGGAENDLWLSVVEDDGDDHPELNRIDRDDVTI